MSDQQKELALKALRRAEQLASIAYDWNLGDNGRVEIDDKMVSCASLGKEFTRAIKAIEGGKA